MATKESLEKDISRLVRSVAEMESNIELIEKSRKKDPEAISRLILGKTEAEKLLISKERDYYFICKEIETCESTDEFDYTIIETYKTGGGTPIRNNGSSSKNTLNPEKPKKYSDIYKTKPSYC